MKILPGLGLLLSVVFLLIACQSPAAEPPLGQVPSLAEVAGTTLPTVPPLPTLAAEEIAVGKKIYELHCATCHGADLEGEPDWKIQNEDNSFKAPPHDADGHTWHHADEELVEAIRLGGARLEGMNIGGTSPMPTYADILTDEEITAVLTYIKSTWPDDVRRTQWEVTVRRSQP